MGKLFDIFDNGYCSFKVEAESADEDCVVFTILVKNHDYSGAHLFVVDKDSFQSNLDGLNKMNKTLTGEVKIEDAASDAYLLIEMNNSDLFVKGQFGSISEDNFLIFKQKLDQTIIRLLYNCFSELLNLKDIN